MPENWDVSPWVFATVGGPVILALAIAWGIGQFRGRHAGPGRRSPDYDPEPERQDRSGRRDQG